MSAGEILKYSLYLFFAVISPFFLTKGIYGLIKNKGNYSFKIVWNCIAYIYGAIILTLFFIKLIYFVSII